MQLIPAIHTYIDDVMAQSVWAELSAYLGSSDGVALYRHPNIGAGGGIVPDFAIISRDYGAIAVRIVRGEALATVPGEDETWEIDGQQVASPIAELGDLGVAFKYRFDYERLLRDKVRVSLLLACPQMTRAQFVGALGEPPAHIHYLWRDGESNTLPGELEVPPSDEEWRLAYSVFQAASKLNRPGSVSFEKADQIGKAIRVLERDIALLDDQQAKVAFQIPPGPQRIRGLAGTGKTVLLAMKAANIHSHFPDKQILFTFNTQSLYNQARDLISKFYRVNKESDPDWNKVHVRHGWGSPRRAGVYSELRARQGAYPLTFQSAKLADNSVPFRACCRQALTSTIQEFYDYILVDEAQDFPKEFFQVLYKLAKDQKRIYFAFDELQSLSSVEIPTSLDLFGVDEEGRPLVDLDGEYPGPMDKDLVLFKSYRCPHQILMLAHALGLGIHSTRGCVQMISNIATWHAIGYEITEGNLQTGQEVVIHRPFANSPNRVRDIYTGKRGIIEYGTFETRELELAAVADAIQQNINEEGVSPEQILVISLDSLSAKKYMSNLQSKLYERGIASVVPGLIDQADQFAEAGRVTLSTVYRAKGNEAPMVYIVSFDSLYDYVREVETRNRAFTCITRSKGWVRISGTGVKMKEADQEISQIIKDFPNFRFTFPDMNKIHRNLDAAETMRRRQIVKSARNSVQTLAGADPAVLSELPAEQVEILLEKLRKIKEIRGES